jgi:peptidoglycan/LPS O-acetylase OafA/YrhL
MSEIPESGRRHGRATTRSLPGDRGKLGDLLSGKANGYGLIRLLMATSVVVSHSYPLGFGRLNMGLGRTGGQTDVGSMAVIGFFVLSGFMITASGRRLTIGRYAWHRALRIMPGLWVCLLVTAFAVAPWLYDWQHGTLSGFWTNPDGPLTYLRGTWNTSMSQGWDISGVMKTGQHRHTNYNNAFEGTLWSLRYEIACYVMVGVLAAGGVLRRARRTVPLLAAALWVLILMNLLDAKGWRGAPSEPTANWHLPLLGWLNSHWVVYLGFAFLVGAAFQLYKDKLPVNDLLALLCLGVMAASLVLGGFFVFGVPAFCYLAIWGGVRTPRWLHWVGRKNDYSYGIYIYGFMCQQVLVMHGFARHGLGVYILLSLAATFVCAWLSWHLVEGPALRLKHWTLPWFRRDGGNGITIPVQSTGPVAETAAAPVG